MTDRQLKIKNLVKTKVGLELSQSELNSLGAFPIVAISEVSKTLVRKGPEISNKLSYLIKGSRNYCQQRQIEYYDGQQYEEKEHIRPEKPITDEINPEGNGHGYRSFKVLPKNDIKPKTAAYKQYVHPEQLDVNKELSLVDALEQINTLEKGKPGLSLFPFLLQNLQIQIERIADRCPELRNKKEIDKNG